MTPTLILGKNYKDNRGVLKYNNVFDVSLVKRMYIIENVDTIFIRCWQGHKIEQRWFTSVAGKFKIDDSSLIVPLSDNDARADNCNFT